MVCVKFIERKKKKGRGGETNKCDTAKIMTSSANERMSNTEQSVSETNKCDTAKIMTSSAIRIAFFSGFLF